MGIDGHLFQVGPTSDADPECCGGCCPFNLPRGGNCGFADRSSSWSSKDEEPAEPIHGDAGRRFDRPRKGRCRDSTIQA